MSRFKAFGERKRKYRLEKNTANARKKGSGYRHKRVFKSGFKRKSFRRSFFERTTLAPLNPGRRKKNKTPGIARCRR